MNITSPQFTDASNLIHDLFADEIGNIGTDGYSERVEEIEFNHVPGFIPFTNGGWNAVACMPFYGDAARCTDLIKPYVERDEQECLDQFLAEHDYVCPEGNDVKECLHRECVLKARQIANGDYTNHPDWEEWVSDWENDDNSPWFVYLRATLFTADNRRNQSGEDEFSFGLAINNDFGYGRDSIGYAPGGSTWVWEREVLAEDVTPKLIEEIRLEIRKAWQDA